MVLFASIIAAVGLFEALAYRYGTDSRPFFDECPSREHRRNL